PHHRTRGPAAGSPRSPANPAGAGVPGPGRPSAGPARRRWPSGSNRTEHGIGERDRPRTAGPRGGEVAPPPPRLCNRSVTQSFESGGTEPEGRGRRARLALVTGATGYIGGRLVPELLDAGWRVRCLARSPEKLRDHPWRNRAEVVRGDLGDPATLPPALEGVHTAYYLVHSMGAAKDFADADARAARAFAAAAAGAGVRRIVYLGGIAPERGRPSPHMASRREVGRILLDGEVPAVVLQAAVILGSGSASFEMLRYLTERLPVMVAPRWVRTRVQPIAVRDVLRLLVKAADLPEGADRAFDVGGPDVLGYADMIHRFARAAGIGRRLIVPVPVLTPRLSGL